MQPTRIVLHRQSYTDEGTFGSLHGLKFPVSTVECPWRNNVRRLSCIPKGEYVTIRHRSPKFGDTFWLQDVPGRSEILIHIGNWAGDTAKGYKSNSLGCILPGGHVAVIKGQRGVSSSGVTMAKLLATLPNEFTLVIEGEH